jgi:hypothetical protein
MFEWLWRRKPLALPAPPSLPPPTPSQIGLILSSLEGVIPNADLAALRALRGQEASLARAEEELRKVLAQRAQQEEASSRSLAQAEERAKLAQEELRRVLAQRTQDKEVAEGLRDRIRRLERDLKDERERAEREREAARRANLPTKPFDPVVERFEWIRANHATLIAPTLVDVPPNLRSLPQKNSVGAVVRWRLCSPSGKYVSRVVKGTKNTDELIKHWLTAPVSRREMNEAFQTALEDIGSLAHDGQLLREFPQFYYFIMFSQRESVAKHVSTPNPFEVLPNEILAAAHLGLFRVFPGGRGVVTEEGFSIGALGGGRHEVEVMPNEATSDQMSGFLARISIGVENAWRRERSNA